MRVVATGVAYRYGSTRPPVLDGVDLDIPSGVCAAIIGPSGSGKTTLLSLIGGLLPLQAGSIAAFDVDGVEQPVGDHASWVLQTVNLLPDRSAAENVAIGAYSAGANKAEAASRARVALGHVGLGAHADDVARNLSGGEAQRVAIARALASHRPIVLADEPTGQLDAKTSAGVLSAMVDGSHGRTVVVVTHDPEVAARCDLVFELRDGHVHQRTMA